MDTSASSLHRLEIGKHVVSVEKGVLELALSGRVNVNEAMQIQAYAFEAADRLGPLGVLAGLDGLNDLDAEARRVFARPPRAYPFYAVAYFGGLFATRVLILTVVRAGKLIMPSAFAFNVQVFATEAEARGFLEAERAQRAGT